MISGKSFSDLCNWVVDPRYPQRRLFRYSDAPNGDWVFVNGDYLQNFHQKFPHLAIKRFNVIVHNTDRTFGEKELSMLLPRAHRIFAINTTVQHPQLITIPIGFVDKQLPFIGNVPTTSTDRPYEIYMNFLMHTNDLKRKECADAFEGDPRVVSKTGLTVPEYYEDLRKSKFVLCPEGTGLDTHRVYESLLCGATPVVLRNSLSSLYEKLPVCIVDSWKDPFVVPTDKTLVLDALKFLR